MMLKALCFSFSVSLSPPGWLCGDLQSAEKVYFPPLALSKDSVWSGSPGGSRGNHRSSLYPEVMTLTPARDHPHLFLSLSLSVSLFSGLSEHLFSQRSTAQGSTVHSRAEMYFVHMLVTGAGEETRIKRRIHGQAPTLVL